MSGPTQINSPDRGDDRAPVIAVPLAPPSGLMAALRQSFVVPPCESDFVRLLAKLDRHER